MGRKTKKEETSSSPGMCPLHILCPVPLPQRLPWLHCSLSNIPHACAPEHRWHFLAPASPQYHDSSLLNTVLQASSEGLPFCSTQNSLHSPTLTCYLPSLLLDSEDFGPDTVFPPSSHPAITLSYCRERRPQSEPGLTSSTFSHASRSIFRLTGQQGLPPQAAGLPL